MFGWLIVRQNPLHLVRGVHPISSFLAGSVSASAASKLEALAIALQILEAWRCSAFQKTPNPLRKCSRSNRQTLTPRFNSVSLNCSIGVPDPRSPLRLHNFVVTIDAVRRWNRDRSDRSDKARDSDSNRGPVFRLGKEDRKQSMATSFERVWSRRGEVMAELDEMQQWVFEKRLNKAGSVLA